MSRLITCRVPQRIQLDSILLHFVIIACLTSQGSWNHSEQPEKAPFKKTNQGSKRRSGQSVKMGRRKPDGICSKHMVEKGVQRETDGLKK